MANKVKVLRGKHYEMLVDKEYELWIQLKVGTMIEFIDYYGNNHFCIITNEDYNPMGFISVEMFQQDSGSFRVEYLKDLQSLQEKHKLTIIHKVETDT